LHHAPILSDEGIAVLDLSGAMGATIGFSTPGIAEPSEDFMAHRMISMPSPTSQALATIWHVLQSSQPIQLSASACVSASRFGQKGIEELAQQVRALLNLQDSPQKIFPDGLAFDLLPSIGGDEDGHSVAEDAIGQELSDLLMIESHQVRTRIQVAPIFSGISLHVQVSCQQEPLLEEVATLFQESPGVDYRQQLPNLRSLMGDGDLFVGRIAINPWIRGVELQAQVDNVTYAVQNGLRMVQRYHQAELL
jgi:aspartate-semialdehyde dehydrogenase